jgi:hypothetical protein
VLLGALIRYSRSLQRVFCSFFSLGANSFLRKVDDSSKWEDVGDDIAREKTSQVLRDAIHAKKSFSIGTKLPPSISKISDIMPTPAPSLSNEGRMATPSTKKETKETRKTPATSASSNSSGSEMRNNQGFSPEFPHPYSSSSRMTHANTFGAPTDGFSQVSMANMMYQYPITPSSANAGLETARKRPRLQHESPLPSFAYQRHYHHRPYSYLPYGQSNTPPVSMMFSPPNFRIQTFPFSPASVAASQSYNQDASTTTTKIPSSDASCDQPGHYFVPPNNPRRGNDCWIVDVPPYNADNSLRSSPRQEPQQRHLEEPFPHHAHEQPSPDFDLFNEELLSDSEHREGSISPYAYPKRDSFI